MSRFKPVMRDMNYLFPPSMSVWLPERHLARFVAEIVEQLDPPLKEDATDVEKMRHLLLAMAGRALYEKRKCTVEPVFGIIK